MDLTCGWCGIPTTRLVAVDDDGIRRFVCQSCHDEMSGRRVSSKLSDWEVAEMRDLRSLGWEVRSLANAYGVSERTVARILGRSHDDT